ncbi:MAG: site-specific integrase [Gammaproteobacteria bacterium]|nr:site-specific integrase [Gammaproteobacteria bacterium]
MQSITELFNMYLQCSVLAESSADIKKRAAGYFLKLFGDMSPDLITFCHTEDFKNFLAKGRSNQSANIYLQNFKPFFTWMMKRGYIKTNPFSELKMFAIGTELTEKFNADELERILKVADTRWKVIVLLGLSSMRRAEILNLTVRDIDFDRAFIYIRGKKDSDTTWPWQIKNHNQAIVPLIKAVEQPLIELIEDLGKQPYVVVVPEYYQRLMDRKAAGTLNFRLRNCPWGNFTRDFYCLLDRASVPRKRFHALRATFATKLDEKKFSLREIQKLMRHSSSQVTARYIRHEQQELIARSGETLNEILCY